ncbi:MAG: Mur ligase family protein [Actinomycetota bacterium]
MRFEDAEEQLASRQPEHMPEPSLDRMRALVRYLDDPQLTYPTIHVTGTNGKTTTARAAAALACAHGVSAGLYVSPHLITVRERLSVCGEMIGEQEFADEWERLLPYFDLVDAETDTAVTYFEALTTLAFLSLADRPVGLGVFEVGMGGSWDATNLIASDVAVICPVGMDHVAELGPTLADIAKEKAGIIKDKRIAVIREQEPGAQAVLEARAAEVGAELKIEFQDWEVDERLQAVGGQSFSIRGVHASYDDLFIPLFGEYAARNAAAGLVAVEALFGKALELEVVREALLALRSPGRLEIIERDPLVVLDGAHNPAGAEALTAALREAFIWERLHVVLSTSANKDLDGIVSPLAVLADHVYLTQNNSVRSADPAVLAERLAAASGARAVQVQIVPSVADAIGAARAAAAPGDLILVTGSLYTVADAYRALGRHLGEN